MAALPPSGLRAALARMLFARAVRTVDVTVALPGGRTLGRPAREGRPVLVLHRPEDFYARLGASGLIGFGEAFMAGDVSAEDPVAVLTPFARRLSTLIPPALQRLRSVALLRQPEGDHQGKGNAQRNISRHYDLSNELFAWFLDPTLTYSAALFPTGDDAAPQGTWGELEGAQHRKVDRLLDATRVGPGTTLLEIGTGWGELSLRAAQRGALVHSITLSEEQRVLALQRVREAGLGHRVRIELCDYRDVRGTYDAVVSVEMVEAVGHRFWPEYFSVLDRAVGPGGRVGLQAITMPHERMLASRDTFTWVQKYIFPGGLLPSEQAIADVVKRHTGLQQVDRLGFGMHYAETLRLWRERFERDPATVEAMGFDEVFRRMWSLYLAYSEAGFRSGYLDVVQLVMEKQP